MIELIDARKAMIAIKQGSLKVDENLRIIDDYLEEQVAENRSSLKKDQQTQLTVANHIARESRLMVQFAEQGLELANLKVWIAEGIACGKFPPDFYAYEMRGK